MPLRKRGRQPSQRLTRAKPLAYHAIRMTNLAAIAANRTARLWWRSASFAARWRD
jgi:hypothetical protein